ncbi:MAG TPA: hypothetical protein VF281_01305 [Candidatus Saccharimonadales bacterium]
MRDKLMMVARNIEKVVSRKKMIDGSHVHVLIELRDEGVLGELDRGIGNGRRENETINRKKFTIIENGLRLAVREGFVLFDGDFSSYVTLGAPHKAPKTVREPLSQQPWNLKLDDPDFDRLPALNGAVLSRLRSWGWGQLDELVAN